MHKTLLFFFITSFTIVISAKDPYLIGFAQTGQPCDWRKNMEADMERELMFHSDMELIIRQAYDDSELQIAQIEEMVEMGIDLLIVAPNEIAPVQPVIEKVYESGIPVVLVDRKILSDKYTAYVGGDNYEIGKTAATYIANQLNFEGEVIEITGLLSSSPFLDRMYGFEDHIQKNYPKINIVKKMVDTWPVEMLEDSLISILQQAPKIKAIYAHVDVTAEIAGNVRQKFFPNRRILIIGVDGLPNPGGGIEMVEKGKIDATLIYSTGGKEAIDIASGILHNEPFKKNNLLPTTLIDKSNVQITRLQYNNIGKLQEDIFRSKDLLETLGGRFKVQQMWLFITLSLLIIIGILSVLLLRTVNKLRNLNKNLAKQKEKISYQNLEIRRVSEQLEEATQAKLKFYTNISHEFRTPLTLIVGPLERMLNDGILDKKSKNEIKIIHRNASRLLRLITQIMDFRRIEINQLKLRASKQNIVAFLNDIEESFSELTKQKNIKLQINSEKEEVTCWFDWDKMDKVFFNLLSNAFKYTPKGGEICINVTDDLQNSEVKIEVTDNGEGIPEEDLIKIFDRYYQVEKSNSLKGTGIGLSLSKELIQLHSGKITAVSKVGKGTTFTICLPLGNSHLSEEEITDQVYESTHSFETVLSVLEEYLPEDQKPVEPEPLSFMEKRKPVILVVEDQKELCSFLKSTLSNSYTIFEAGNGREALERIEENEPDIVISDVMMPVMNGLELTKRIKSELRYCHIPVILLTAKSSLEHLLEGLEEGADVYIPKPFNLRHLQIRIEKLLEAKNKIREKYRDVLQVHEKESGLNKMDRNFLQKIGAIISNSRFDEKVNIEEICNKMGLSRVHLYRKVKKLTGMPVSEYVKKVQLSQSLDLLKSSGKSISEVAYEVGFSSPSYFTKCFKAHFKISPTEFREQ